VRLHAVNAIRVRAASATAGAARAAFLAGSGPADDTSSRRVLAPRVSASDRPRPAAHTQA
jgi:hypothetical protein